jgi:uncharacterized protein YwqG
MLTRKRIRELIDQHGLSDRADEIMAEVRPSIHLTLRYDVDEADIPIGASKMGGSPDVPEGFEFLMWNGQYLSFIAQIRLSDAKPYDLEGLLPERGMLYFFFEFFQYTEHIQSIDGKPWGPYKVFYIPDESVPLIRMQQPVSEYPYNDKYEKKSAVNVTETYEACPIVFEQEWIINLPDNLIPRLPPSPSPEQERERDKAFDWWWAVDEELHVTPQHRLVGEAFHIHGRDVVQNASKAWNLGKEDDWTLLLQVDYDSRDRDKPGYVDSDTWDSMKPGFEWGDLGLIYFCINKDDLRARRFDRIGFYYDCY